MRLYQNKYLNVYLSYEATIILSGEKEGGWYFFPFENKCIPNF